MNFFSVGTNLNSMIKFSEMNLKWESRKSNTLIEEKKFNVIESPELKRLKEMAENSRKQNYIKGLESKLKTGGTLTDDELKYLKTNYPELYQDAIETKNEREQYKRELENCRTQEDVDRLNMNKMNGFVSQAKTVCANPNISKAKKIQILDKIMAKIMGINNDFAQFTKSGAYDALPKQDDKQDKKTPKEKIKPEIKEEIPSIGKSAKQEIEKQIENVAKEPTNTAPAPPKAEVEAVKISVPQAPTAPTTKLAKKI